MIRRARAQEIIQTGTVRWEVFGEYQDILFGPDGLRLQEWIDAGYARVIKTGPGRLIYHVKHPKLDFYIKHFRPYSRLNFLHNQVRQGRARKECQLAQHLSELGIDTICPIALGERRRFGALCESFLVSLSIPDSLTLFELMEKHRQTNLSLPTAMRREFSQKLASIAARIHDAGFEHRDLHERNIVLQPLPDGHYKFYLLDLHEVQVHRRLSWGMAEKELARMGRYFTLRSSLVDRYHFFLQYAQERNLSFEEARRLARRMERVTLASRTDFWRRRDRRPARRISQIVEHRRGRLYAQSLSEVSPELVNKILDNPDRLFKMEGIRWLKRGRYTRVASLQLPELDSTRSFVYKQHLFKGWHEWFFTLFKPNQAQRAWRSGASLLLREIPTAKPLILVHRLFLGLPVCSYLLMEQIPGAASITAFLETHLQVAPKEERRTILKGVLEPAARLLRTLHDRKVTHRDLKSSNVLLTHDGNPAEPKVWVIDLDGVSTWSEIPMNQRLQNLSRFCVSFYHSKYVSRTDRLRFLRLYLGRAFQDKATWKTFWREICRRAEQKIQRNLRAGRTVV